MELEDLMGTPITGSGVEAAITPGRWAAPPAPAIITFMPLSAAPLANSATWSGVLCALRALISKGISMLSKNSAADFITGMSDMLPMMMLTIGFMLILNISLCKINIKFVNS